MAHPRFKPILSFFSPFLIYPTTITTTLSSSPSWAEMQTHFWIHKFATTIIFLILRSFESKILCLPTSGLWKEMRYCNHQLDFKKEICGYVWCFHLLYLFAILCKPHKIRAKQNWKAMQVQIIRWITNLNINYQSNKLIMHINKLKSSYIFAQRFLKLKIQTEKITKKIVL